MPECHNTFKQLNTAANRLIKILQAHGVVIQRYDSITTSSIYLKFDYGTANSVRISDHEGKSHLKYRYNLMLNEGEFRSTVDKYPRFYWPVDQVEACARLILEERQAKMLRYGSIRYKGFMDQNRSDHAQSRGFWSDAWLVRANA